MSGLQVWAASALVSVATLLIGAVLAPFCAVLAETGRRLVAGAPWRPVLRDAAMVCPGALSDLLRLFRQPTPREDETLPAAGLLSLALAAGVLALSPGLAVGPALQSAADLPTLLVLLALGRLAALVAGGAATTPPGHVLLVRMGLAAAGTALMLLAVFAVTGALGTWPLLGMLAATGTFAPGALLVLGLVAALLPAADPLPDDACAGRDLAVLRAAAALRETGWITLLTALLCPGTVAAPGWSAGHWLLAIGMWPVRLLAGALLLGGLQRAASRLPDRRSLLLVSLVCALLAVLLTAPGLRAAE